VTIAYAMVALLILGVAVLGGTAAFLLARLLLATGAGPRVVAPAGAETEVGRAL
jgi:hypothetical protein